MLKRSTTKLLKTKIRTPRNNPRARKAIASSMKKIKKQTGRNTLKEHMTYPHP